MEKLQGNWLHLNNHLFTSSFVVKSMYQNFFAFCVIHQIGIIYLIVPYYTRDEIRSQNFSASCVNIFTLLLGSYILK